MSIKFAERLVTCLLFASLFSSVSVAQQTTPPPNAQTQTQTQPQASGQDQKTQPSDNDKSGQNASGVAPAGTSKDRLFYTLPNFLTLENAGKLAPLTWKQKFSVVARGTFDPVQYPWWGLLAGVSQAENSEPAYRQGAVGYAKRYGTTAADSMIENFMVGAVFPSILHQDPRYYQSGKGGFGRRTGYAISRIFVTRSDSGSTQFNYSEIVGSALAASISTYSYHPEGTYISTPTNPHMFIASDRTLVNTASVWGTQVCLDTVTLVVKEFWPDVRRKLAHKSKPGQVGSSGQ